MTLVLGVDPGNSGAFATYDSVSKRVVDVQDMPVWYQVIGKKKRPRLDTVALADMFEVYEMMGVELMVLEAVGGRPQQGAGAAFVFGYGVGCIYATATIFRIPVETVPPASWKALMRVPGKGLADDTAIMQRANEMFPLDRDMFTGPKGGKMVDRAEAAMLARFGAEHVLQIKGARDIQNLLTYRNADTGA